MKLGWIDYSDADRRRTMSILDSLKTGGAVDEIGIDIARDAFSNAFFPSTSVLHTRAKYLIVVPCALKDLENDIGKVRSPGHRIHVDCVPDDQSRRRI